MKTSVKTPIVHPIIVPADNSLRSYNFYLVEYEKSLLLVDAGIDTDVCYDHLLAGLDKIGATITDLDSIILTHNHADHIGLTNRIRSLHDVPVYAHPNAVVRLKRDKDYLEARAPFFKKLYEQMGCGDKAKAEEKRLQRAIVNNQSQKITGTILPIEEGEAIFGLQVIEVFGHSPDHIALFHEDSGILLAGDHVIAHSSSNALVDLGTDGERIRSLEIYEYTLKKIKHLPINLIYPGHGEVIYNPYNVIKQKLERIQKRADRLKTYLSDPKTPSQLAKEIYRDRYDTLFPLVMSEIIGHLDRLETLQKVTKEMHDKVFYYSLL